MNHRIVYDNQAQRQIEEAYRYGKEHFGPRTAARFKEALRKSIALLKQHPLMGSVEPELSTGRREYRYLLVRPYKIVYSFADETVRIHLLWHTSRSPQSMPEEVTADGQDG